MKIKDAIILTFGSLFLGWSVLHIKPATSSQDTTLQVVDTLDTLVNAKGKTALFIGDSHTANQQFGWQKQLSDSVGFNMINSSEVGKTTYWMLNMALYKLTDKIDYCFVYGGANDMFSSNIAVEEAIENIKGIARMCNRLGVKCYILTGFDPVTCTRTKNPRYAFRYATFQRLLLEEYFQEAVVIDTRVVSRIDCADGLCHMTKKGHTKVASVVIRACNFKTVK